MKPLLFIALMVILIVPFREAGKPAVTSWYGPMSLKERAPPMPRAGISKPEAAVGETMNSSFIPIAATTHTSATVP